MKTYALIAALGILLAGCASKQEMAAADSAECKSWGAQPGTEAYLRCRAYMDQRRLAERKAIGKAVAAGIEGYSEGYNRAADRAAYGNRTTTTNCYRNGNAVNCTSY